MKVAFVPWDSQIHDNNIFIPKYLGYVDSHILLKRTFQEHGDDINTIDMYKNLKEVDLFLFSTLNYVWLIRVIQAGLIDRCVYCSGEPAVVKPLNCYEGYEKLKRVFPYIMTFDDDLVDNDRIFKRTLPYYFQKNFGNISFSDRKLLVNISGNKHSNHPQELYSEREKVVSFFEKNYLNSISLYGTCWDINTHPSYQGYVEDKATAYHHHKFALSLENMCDVKGYITEKIFDCFQMGIVPIYKGASDIDKYVPRRCYINYSDFENLDDLANFLFSMEELEYQKYLDAIDELLQSDIFIPFSHVTFYEQIRKVYEKGKIKDFKLSHEVILKLRKQAVRQYIGNKRLHYILLIKKILKLNRK